MALTGLDIYKQLPKKNCGECGSPTCLAFAMALAQNKTELDKCPYVTEEAKAALESASAPPQRLIKIGVGDSLVEIGNEQVMFRHEQTFWHQPVVAVSLNDDDPELAEKAKNINDMNYERVALPIIVEMIVVVNNSGNADTFKSAVTTVAENSNKLLSLISDNPDAIKLAVESVKDRKPVIGNATSENFEGMAVVAKECGCPLVVSAGNLDEMAELSPKVKDAGVEDLILNTNANTPKAILNDYTHMRRLALKKQFRNFGYPTISFINSDDPEWNLATAVTAVCKYAGIIVLAYPEKWMPYPLLASRQCIYTDPRKPIQVEAKIYEVGNVNENSPVIVTTNFSLTYYTVEPEVEGSKIGAYIVVVDTEGMSVLTAFAADKFGSEHISNMLNSCGIADKVSHRKVIIPGYIAVISGKLQEESGWEIMVGPREAAALGSYLKQVWNN